ncbi:MAG: hypothetical protein GY950_09895, partial [bacterium]|nr:hypothetical protein [bacterium]
FLGRIDHQVKIRGFRIEPGEIENRLLKHARVKEAVVCARSEKNNDKYLCAYVVAGCTAADLKEYLAASLPGYMVPAYFVMMEKIPLNPSGKVDRKALPQPVRTAKSGYVPPGNEREKVLTGIWAGVLGLESSRIGINDNFFHLGGHSLKAVGLVGRIYKAFHVEMPITQLFKTPTVKGISAYIEKSETGIYSSLLPVEKKEHYPLSSAQERLFFIHLLDPAAIVYNLPGIMELEGIVEKDRIEGAFKRLIYRFESLRTSFEMYAEIPVQKIHETVEFEIEYDCTEETFFRSF